MATDFSQLFGQAAQPTSLGPIATRDPFALAGPKAAMFKRKRVMQEASEQGLEVDDGEAFFSFVGNRLQQLGDGEGAMATMQKFQEFQQQQVVNQQNQQALGIDQGNLEVNRGNLAEKLTKGKVRTLTPEEAEAAGYPPDTVVQRDERTGKDTVTRAGKTLTPGELKQALAKGASSAAKISIGDKERQKAEARFQISLKEASDILTPYRKVLSKLNDALKAGDAEAVIEMESLASALKVNAGVAMARMQNRVGILTDKDVTRGIESLPTPISVRNAFQGGDAFEKQVSFVFDTLGILDDGKPSFAGGDATGAAPAQITPEMIDELSDEQVDALYERMKGGQ